MKTSCAILSISGGIADNFK